MDATTKKSDKRIKFVFDDMIQFKQYKSEIKIKMSNFIRFDNIFFVFVLVWMPKKRRTMKGDRLQYTEEKNRRFQREIYIELLSRQL